MTHQLSVDSSSIRGWFTTDRFRLIHEFARSFLRSKTGTIGLIIVAILLITAIFAPLLAPYDPYELHVVDSLRPPSTTYLLGTDDLGRDILSRIIYGARVSLLVGFISIGLACLSGVPLGLIAGYKGGTTDALIMRLLDALLAFPAILLAIALMAVLGPSLQNAMIAIGIIYTPTFARITRSSVLSLREKEFVEASRAGGAGDFYLLFRIILPNCLSPIIVQSSLGVGYAILVEAALSFLGLGVQPPYASWGSMLYYGRTLLGIAPWFTTFPGIAIFFTVLGLNFLGDGLREVMDPRQTATPK